MLRLPVGRPARRALACFGAALARRDPLSIFRAAPWPAGAAAKRVCCHALPRAKGQRESLPANYASISSGPQAPLGVRARDNPFILFPFILFPWSLFEKALEYWVFTSSAYAQALEFHKSSKFGWFLQIQNSRLNTLNATKIIGAALARRSALAPRRTASPARMPCQEAIAPAASLLPALANTAAAGRSGVLPNRREPQGGPSLGLYCPCRRP